MNIARHFYKEIYTEEDIIRLLSRTWNQHNREIERLKQDARLISTIMFSAHVGTEGLLVGSSLKPYGSVKSEGDHSKESSDLKLGMYLDHTTGLPLIKGHGIKGPLKVFLRNDVEYIYSLLPDDENINFSDFLSTIRPVLLRRDTTLSILDQVNFEDAVPVQNDGTAVFIKSTFTPHQQEIFKDPTPLVHLRVSPGSKYWFPMRIYERKLVEALSLVYPIFLASQGVGSHTGYNLGQFTDARQVN